MLTCILWKLNLDFSFISCFQLQISAKMISEKEHWGSISVLLCGSSSLRQQQQTDGELKRDLRYKACGATTHGTHQNTVCWANTPIGTLSFFHLHLQRLQSRHACTLKSEHGGNAAADAQSKHKLKPITTTYRRGAGALPQWRRGRAAAAAAATN